MKNKHIAKTIIISTIVTVFQCFISLVLTPLVTNTVGMEAYGFVTLAKNFTNYANILMIALNSYASRYITIAYLRDKKKDFQKYFSTVFIVDFFVGGLILLIGIGFICIMEYILIIPNEIIFDVKILFILTFISFFLTTISTVFVSSAYVKNKLDIYNSIKALAYFVQGSALFIGFLVLNTKVWFVGVAICLTSITILTGTVIMTKRYLPEAKIRIKDVSSDAFFILTKNGLWNSINSVGNALNSGLDVLVTNLMLTAIGMGQISVAKTVSGLVTSFYSVLGTPFQPVLLKYYSEKNMPGVLKTLKESMQCCGIVTNTIFSVFIVIGSSFLNLWIPGQNIRLINSLCILALLPSVSEGCVYPLYYIYTLTLKNRFPCIVTIIGGLLNVVGMFFLIRYTNLGLNAVLITTAIIMNIINLVTNPLYMSHCLKIKYMSFYPQIIRNIISCAVATCVLIFLGRFLPNANNWLYLFGEIIVLGLVAMAVQIPIQLSLEEIKEYEKKIIGIIKKGK